MAERALEKTLPFRYQVLLSNRRTVQLRIKDGQVTVRAPKGISDDVIKHFLRIKTPWVLTHLARLPKVQVANWLERTEVLINGEVHAFSWILATKAQVLHQANGMLIQIPTRVSIARREIYLKRQLQQYFTAQAMRFFEQLVAQMASLMQVQYRAIKIGNWQSKWGYCTSKAEVGFNWRLMQAPEWVARYVVVHELAHITHLNHSKAFWQVVARYEPRFKEAKAWLKQHQAFLL